MIVLQALALLLLVLLLLGGALALFAANTARRVEAALPPRGRFLDAGDARLHYVDEGSGRPVVMIHGLGGQLGHFTYAVTGQLRDTYRVVALDRPGSGYSTRSGSARLSAQASAIAALIRALRLEQPVLVGHSLGGALALAVALEHPEVVGGLALVSPLTQVLREPPAAFRRLAIRSALARRLIGWTLALPLSIRNSRALLAMVFAPEPVPPDYAMRAGGLLGLRPRAFIETSADLVAVNDDLPAMVPRYPSLRIPVGVLFGRDDPILDPALHGEALVRAIPGATLALVDGGHMLPVTQPDAVAAFVRAMAARTVSA